MPKNYIKSLLCDLNRYSTRARIDESTPVDPALAYFGVIKFRSVGSNGLLSRLVRLGADVPRFSGLFVEKNLRARGQCCA